MSAEESQNPKTQEQLSNADDQLGIVHVVAGKTGKNEDFYAYISVKPSRYEEFLLIAAAGEEMNLEEFGEILKTGFGREPLPEVRREMEEKHGVDHNFIANLQSEIQKQQKNQGS